MISFLFITSVDVRKSTPNENIPFHFIHFVYELPPPFLWHESKRNNKHSRQLKLILFIGNSIAMADVSGGQFKYVNIRHIWGVEETLECLPIRVAQRMNETMYENQLFICETREHSYHEIRPIHSGSHFSQSNLMDFDAPAFRRLVFFPQHVRVAWLLWNGKKKEITIRRSFGAHILRLLLYVTYMPCLAPAIRSTALHERDVCSIALVAIWFGKSRESAIFVSDINEEMMFIAQQITVAMIQLSTRLDEVLRFYDLSLLSIMIIITVGLYVDSPTTISIAVPHVINSINSPISSSPEW